MWQRWMMTSCKEEMYNPERRRRRGGLPEVVEHHLARFLTFLLLLLLFPAELVLAWFQLAAGMVFSFCWRPWIMSRSVSSVVWLAPVPNRTCLPVSARGDRLLPVRVPVASPSSSEPLTDNAGDDAPSNTFGKNCFRNKLYNAEYCFFNVLQCCTIAGP